jgi:hypothetical protein
VEWVVGLGRRPSAARAHAPLSDAHMHISTCGFVKF